MAQDALIRIRAKVSGQREVKNLERQFKQTEDRTKALKRSFGGLRGAVAGLGVTLGAVQAIKFTLVSTAELETQTRSLEVLTGSLESAKTVISELQAFGAVTPFTSAELIDTAKRLRAFGVDTEKLVATTQRLGDVAGATGADLGGVATAFGQIVAKGRLQGEELLQLQERGINLQDELQEMYGLTAEEFRKALEGGRISAEAVELALKNVTDAGGKYANGAIAQSDTLAGLFSTLQDNVTRLAQQLGNVLAPTLKQITNLAIDGLNTINRQFEAGKTAADLGLKGPALDRIVAEANKQADELANLRFPGVGGGFEKSAQRNQLFLERFNDLVKQYGYRTGQLTAEISKIDEDALTIPDLLQAKTTTKARRTGKSAEELRLERIEKVKQEFQKFGIQQENLARQAIASIQEETSFAQLRLEKGEEFANVTQRITDLVQQGVPFSEAFGLVEAEENVRKLQQAQDEANARQKQQAEELKSVYKSIGDTITSGISGAIEGVIFQTKSLQESLSDILNSVARLLIQFGTKSLLGGFSFANGGVFNENKIVPFARGGLVDKPTLFPMANGMGLMGEAGPEAIMPLRRDASGRLGVEASGGGTSIVVNVDAQGTNVQGDEGKSRQLGSAISTAVQAELIKQQRPGGLLAR